jgi:mono/diheme cytochrome c family protein
VNTAPNARTVPRTPPQGLALLAAGALAALLAAGCAKHADRTAEGAAPAGGATAASKNPGAAQGDAAHGRTIYAVNCAGCHGQTGAEAIVGPPLRHLKRRMTFAQAVAWIKDPRSPMPKLYPDTLSAKDVADVAAYVETL